MIKLPLLWRGDLARVLEQANSESAEDIARALGFQRREGPRRPEVPIGEDQGDDEGILTEIHSEIGGARLASIPLLQPSTFKPFGPPNQAEDSASSATEAAPDDLPAETWRIPSKERLGDLALMERRAIEDWLAKSLSPPLEARDINVAGLIGKLARAEPLTNLPREIRNLRARQIRVVKDRSAHLAPIWADQDQVIGVLRHFAPNARIHEMIPDAAQLACVSCDDPYQRAVWPEQKDEIWIALTDFGCFAQDERLWPIWAALGRTLGRTRALALCPADLSKIPPQFHDLWQIRRWDERAVPADTETLKRDAAMLLRLTSLVRECSRGLLRVLRLSALPQSDPAIEFMVWNDPEMIRFSDQVIALTADRALAEMQRLTSTPDDGELITRALAAIRVWRAQPDVPDSGEALWFPEILNMPPLIRALLPDAEEISQARAFFRNLDARSQGGLTRHQRAYLSIVGDSARGAWEDPAFRAAVWSVKFAQHGYTPPVPPDDLRTDAPLGSLWVWQSGKNLQFRSDRRAGQTPLNDLESNNGIIEIKPVPPPSLPPPPTTFRDRLADGTEGPEMVAIPTGSFLMGSPVSDTEAYKDEKPQHEVQITEPFALAKYPVTFEEYDAFCAATGRKKPDDRGWGRGRRPVINVNWEDAQAYCDWLSAETGEPYRLPSEAEWEYACRAGTKTRYFWGDAWDAARANAARQFGKTTDVGSYVPNPWGLHDINGNVWEWCQDHWSDDYAHPRTQVAFRSNSGETVRVLRGGSWIVNARYCRSAIRNGSTPGDRYDWLGFRPARGQATGAQAGSGGAAGAFGPARGAVSGANAKRPGGAESSPPQRGGETDFFPAEAKRLRVMAGGSASIPLAELPKGPFVIRTDRAELVIQRITRSDLGGWAAGMGRDRFGLWADFEVEDIRQRLRWCPPGCFLMGSPEDEPGRYDNEGPQTEITLTSGFWLFDTPVTQALYEAVMGNNPSHFQSPTRPMETVSWDVAQQFIATMNERFPSDPDKDEGRLFVLPSEAQWEYACRAGTTTATWAGPMEILGENNAPILNDIAWYRGNSGTEFDLDNGYDSSDWEDKAFDYKKAGTMPVGLKRANPWGLYDMHGNVWEWCADIWSDNHAGASPDGAPRQTSQQNGETDRVLRGGSWYNTAGYCRSAIRYRYTPDGRGGNIGFRPARGQATGAQARTAERSGAGPGKAGEAEPTAGRRQRPPPQRGGESPNSKRGPKN